MSPPVTASRFPRGSNYKPRRTWQDCTWCKGEGVWQRSGAACAYCKRRKGYWVRAVIERAEGKHG